MTHPLMLTRKSIDTVLLSVGAEKLTTRMGLDENAQTMDPPPAMVTTSILKRRGDTAAPLPCYRIPGFNPSSCCPVLLPAL